MTRLQQRKSGSFTICGIAVESKAVSISFRSNYARVVCWTWILALLVICVRVGVFPHRQSSYATDYVPAGWRWLHGAEVYGKRQGFVYSPLIAAFFAPFSVLPPAVGGVFWRLLGAAGMLAAAVVWLGSRWSDLGQLPARRPDPATVPTACLLFLPLAVGNLNLGQMNVPVLALAAGGVLAAGRQGWNLAALLLALAAFIKIYPLALGLLLVVLYPRELSWRLLLALLGLFVVSFGLQHPPYIWREYHRWIAVLGGDNRLDTGLRYTWRDFGYLLRAGGVPLSDRAYRFMEVAAGGALALFLLLGQRRGRWPREKLVGGTFCLGCAWMMLFGPATEAATYVVLALPVCGLLVAAWTRPAVASERRFVLGSRAVLTTAYLLLLCADGLNSWWHGQARHLFTRTLQPDAALLFTAQTVWSLLRSTPAPSTAPLPVAPPGSTVPDGNDFP